jgi:RNase P subunit RPR2
MKAVGASSAVAAAAAADAAASATSRMRFLHEMAHAALHINPLLSQFYLEALRDLAAESSIDLHESFTRTVCP